MLKNNNEKHFNIVYEQFANFEKFCKKNSHKLSFAQTIYLIYNLFYNLSTQYNIDINYDIEFCTENADIDNYNKISNITIDHITKKIIITTNFLDIIGANGQLFNHYIDIITPQTPLKHFIDIFVNRIIHKLTNFYINSNLGNSISVNKSKKDLKIHYAIKGLQSLSGITQSTEELNKIHLKCSDIFWKQTRTKCNLQKILENVTNKKITIYENQEYTNKVSENHIIKLGNNSYIGQIFIGKNAFMKNGINIQIEINSEDLPNFLPQSYIPINSPHITQYTKIKSIIQQYLGCNKPFKISFKVLNITTPKQQKPQKYHTQLGTQIFFIKQPIKKMHKVQNSYIINVHDADFYCSN